MTQCVSHKKNRKIKALYPYEKDGKLSSENIIMQYVNYYDYGDGYLNITVNGSGKGKYITNGKAIDITWKKDLYRPRLGHLRHF